MIRRSTTFLILLLLLADARAGVRPLSLKELCQGAERIVIGTVTKLASRWEGTVIVTDATIVPLETLKGAGNAPFMVTIPGGTVGSQTLKVGEAPVFAAGETVVLFVKPGKACGVYGWFRGKYTVVGDKVRELRDTSLAQFRGQILEELERLEHK